MAYLHEACYGESSHVHTGYTSRLNDGAGIGHIRQKEQNRSSERNEVSGAVYSGDERNGLWDELTFLNQSLETFKAKLSEEDWDPDEIKWIKERYALVRKQALQYLLQLQIDLFIGAVAYPGEKLTYLQICQRVLPGFPKNQLTQALDSMGLSPAQQVYFKVDRKVETERAEQLLLSMIGDVKYVFAKDFNDKINLHPNSVLYKELVKQLKTSGWSWSSKKINGKVHRIIKR